MRPTGSATIAVLVAALSFQLAWSAEPNAQRVGQSLRYAQRGLKTLDRGNTVKALEDFQKAIELVPSLPEAHIGLGHLAMREERFEDALREYSLAREGFGAMSKFIEKAEND